MLPSIEESIRVKVTSQLEPEYLEVENESHGHNVPKNSETHFRLVVVSAHFDGQSRLERQRKVQDLFQEERTRGLHALTMRLMTPAEWDLVKADFQMQSPPCHGGSKK